MDIRSIMVSPGGAALKVQAISQRIQLDICERNLKTFQLVLLSIRDHLDGLGPVLPHSGG